MKTEKDVKPWYRQFWFWFVFAPLIVVVCSTSVMVSIAFRHADDVVMDNYYKQGRMINQTMEQDRRAFALNLTAHLRFDRVTGEVFLQMPAQESLPQALLLLLDHPFEADLDEQIILHQIAAGQYRGDLQSNPQHNWYLSLLPELDKEKRKDAEWLLSGTIDFAAGDETELKPRVNSPE